MLFLTSGVAGPTYKAAMAHQEHFGRFVGPATKRYNLSGWQTWVGDNGAFTGFNQERFMKYVKQLFPFRDTCKCMTVPDVPYFWQPTLVKFHDWAPSIRRMGFPIGLAVQDGATIENIPWGEIDALFVGGSTEWKRQQYRKPEYKEYSDMPLFSGTPICSDRPTAVKDIVEEAKRRHLWVHIGRSANGIGQLQYAYRLGADSVDGTGERMAPDKQFRWIAQTMWELNCGRVA